MPPSTDDVFRINPSQPFRFTDWVIQVPKPQIPQSLTTDSARREYHANRIEPLIKAVDTRLGNGRCFFNEVAQSHSAVGVGEPTKKQTGQIEVTKLYAIHEVQHWPNAFGQLQWTQFVMANIEYDQLSREFGTEVKMTVPVLPKAALPMYQQMLQDQNPQMKNLVGPPGQPIGEVAAGHARMYTGAGRAMPNPLPHGPLFTDNESMAPPSDSSRAMSYTPMPAVSAFNPIPAMTQNMPTMGSAYPSAVYPNMPTMGSTSHSTMVTNPNPNPPSSMTQSRPAMGAMAHSVMSPNTPSMGSTSHSTTITNPNPSLNPQMTRPYSSQDEMGQFIQRLVENDAEYTAWCQEHAAFVKHAIDKQRWLILRLLCRQPNAHMQTLDELKDLAAREVFSQYRRTAQQWLNETPHLPYNHADASGTLPNQQLRYLIARVQTADPIPDGASAEFADLMRRRYALAAMGRQRQILGSWTAEWMALADEHTGVRYRREGDSIFDAWTGIVDTTAAFNERLRAEGAPPTLSANNIPLAVAGPQQQQQQQLTGQGQPWFG